MRNDISLTDGSTLCMYVFAYQRTMGENLRKKSVGDEASRRLNTLVQLIERSSVISPIVIQIHKVTYNSTGSTFKLDKLLRTNSLLMGNLVRYAGRKEGEDWDNLRFLPHAIEALGLKGLRNAVFGLEAARMAMGSAVTRKRLWAHSLRCASQCAAIANRVMTVAEDDAFFAGIMHDFGVICLDEVGPDYYSRLLQKVGMTMVGLESLERDRMRFDHAEVVTACLETWGASEDVISSIFSHHEEKKPLLGAMLELADQIDIWMMVGVPNVEVAAMAADHPQNKRVGLSSKQYEAVLKTGQENTKLFLDVVGSNG